MVTRLYSHPIYLEHLTPSGHPERPDRLRAIERVLEDEKFAALDRVKAPEGDPATILYAHPESFVDKVRRAIPEDGISSVDADTSVSPKSWQAALTAIGAANAAVDDVFSGRAANVFVASRPPATMPRKPPRWVFVFSTTPLLPRAMPRRRMVQAKSLSSTGMSTMETAHRTSFGTTRRCSIVRATKCRFIQAPVQRMRLG